MRVSVVVNDMSEVNINADLVRDGGFDMSRTEEVLVEMSNRCICCTLREDRLLAVRKMAEQVRFDYLLIEFAGVGEPLPVAATFYLRNEECESLGGVAAIDTMVTVVDSAQLPANYSSSDFLRDRGQPVSPEDSHAVVGLLADQIEFANVVLLNKLDVATPDQLNVVRSVVRSLNARAEIVESSFGKVPLHKVLGTGRFDPAEAEKLPLWFCELQRYAGHKPETRAYGITSFIYRPRKPIYPQRSSTSFNPSGQVSRVRRADSGSRRVRLGPAFSVSQKR